MAALLNWLVIGVGDITRRRVLPAILQEDRSRLAGIVTRDPSKAAAYGVPAWTSLTAALSESKAEAVYVASPVFLHGPQTLECLSAGRHVLCEKPMAMNWAEAASMRDSASACQRVLGIAYYRRTYPKVARARELMAQGTIGTPVIAEATSHGWFDGRDTSRAWLVEPAKAGGGPLFDVASHRIDLMNFLFGAPQQATGMLSSQIHGLDVEDNATVLTQHASGVRGVVDVRWHSRVDRDEFRIRGTEGEIDLSPLNGVQLRSPLGTENLPNHPNLHFPCVRNFVEAVLDGSPLLSSAETAIYTDWVAERVLQTARASMTTAGQPPS